jgi:hypothetical protein
VLAALLLACSPAAVAEEEHREIKAGDVAATRLVGWKAGEPDADREEGL